MSNNSLIKNKGDWYHKISELISEDLENFLQSFYQENDTRIYKVGSSYRIDPCPVCTHNGSSTVSNENSVHCFSCNWKGTYINAWVDYATGVKGQTKQEALNALANFYNIEYPYGEIENPEEIKKQTRLQEISAKAETFYHNALMSSEDKVSFKDEDMTPLEYLLNVRKRNLQTIKDYKVGISKNYEELEKSLLDLGYEKSEIKESKIRIPENLIVYFYKNPITKVISRLNTKNPFGVKSSYKDDSGEWVKSEQDIQGLSQGYRVPYFPPKFSFNDDMIVVEGENDAHAVYDQGYKNVVAIGGNPSSETLQILNQCKSKLYLMFDNDHKGMEYTTLVNNSFPHIPVFEIKYDSGFNDPDDYFRGASPVISVKDLMANALPLETEEHKIFHDKNVWSIQNRTRKLEFTIKSSDKGGKLTGQANLYENGKLSQRQEDTVLSKCKGKMSPINFALQDEMDKYFNSNLEKLNIKELATRFEYSSRKQQIITTIARKLHALDNEEVDVRISELKKEFKSVRNSEKIVESIIMEYSMLAKDSIEPSQNMIPKMKLAQYYNLLNNDAYFYFTYKKDDGDAIRSIPYLLKNDKSLIRLDLLRRKDQQCLLLVDKKYELAMEAPTAMIDPRNCSLQDGMVEDFREGKIKDELISPRRLINEIESWIKRFFYTRDENAYKVLALWIYGTYFYIMFSQYPYLFINGEKGSGKTILDNVLSMFAFNSKLLVDVSESSLFRTAAIEGGTIILDEQENFTSRTSSIQSSMGAILKSGYASSAYVSRFNLEKNSNDLFDPFCPKVISNIFGLEDIILDRCIPINTFRVSSIKNLDIEDPKYYIENNQEPYKNVTSRCCFSALTHFQELNDIYRDKENQFEATNARLSQILTPIFSVAKLADKGSADNEYQVALDEYFAQTISFYKEEMEQTTPEGIIKHIVSSVANELLNPNATKEYTDGDRKYNTPILYSIEEGWFEMNLIHFKVFLEESMPGDNVFVRTIPKWLKTCFLFNKDDIKRKTCTLEHEDLIKEFKGVTKTKVNSYKFYFRNFSESNFLDEEETQIIKEEVELF